MFRTIFKKDQIKPFMEFLDRATKEKKAPDARSISEEMKKVDDANVEALYTGIANKYKAIPDAWKSPVVEACKEDANRRLQQFTSANFTSNADSTFKLLTKLANGTKELHQKIGSNLSLQIVQNVADWIGFIANALPTISVVHAQKMANLWHSLLSYLTEAKRLARGTR